jgi:hypothetical protein
MMIIAAAGGVADWRQSFFLGSAQEAMRLDDKQMDHAMATARLFPIPYR